MERRSKSDLGRTRRGETLKPSFDRHSPERPRKAGEAEDHVDHHWHVLSICIYIYRLLHGT